MKVKIILFIAFFLMRCNSEIAILLSQVQQEWVNIYNGPGNGSDGASGIVVDNAENIYVTGSVWMGWTGGYKIATIKYNSSGTELWVQIYGALNGHYVPSITIDDSANIYIGSATGMGWPNQFDYLTLKYDSSGVLLWTQTYNGPGSDSDIVQSIQVDESGYVYITGESVGQGTFRDFATIKYSNSGIQQWAARFNGAANGVDRANSLAVDNAGNVYVTGTSQGKGDNAYEITTVKYDSAGTELWVKKYHGNFPGYRYDGGNAITIGKSSDVYITGQIFNYTTNNDCVTIKYSSAGALQWVQVYDSLHYSDYGKKILVDSLDNVIVTGWRGGPHIDFLTIKYTSTGVQQWVQTLNDSLNGNDYANDITLDKYGNIYVTGSFQYNQDNYDFGTVKYSNSGVQEWLAIYDGPSHGYDAAGSIAIGNNGNVYVAGTSNNIGSSDNYCTIKYSQLIGIHNEIRFVPGEIALYQNFPNPFNPITKIEFSLPNITKVTLSVYDIMGRLIRKLVDEIKPEGIHSVIFDGSKVASGLYFCRLETDNFTQYKKMLLVK